MVNTMTKSTLGWKGLILLILPGDSPSLREVIVGTQGEQALGGRNYYRGRGSLASQGFLSLPSYSIQDQAQEWLAPFMTSRQYLTDL